MQSLPHSDVLIVGAGFSGLIAARKLRAAGRSVRILEARERPGGRIKPGSIAGVTIDLGGMWVGTEQKRLRALVEEFGLTTYPTWLEGECAIEMFGRITRCPREDFAPALPLSAKIEYALLDRKLKAMIAAVPADNPAAAPRAAEWDSMSLGEWMRRNVRTRGLRLMLEMVTESVFCAEPGDVSLLHWLFYMKSGGGFDRMISAEPGGAQHLLIEGGLHQAAARLADELADAIEYEAPVRSIEQDESGVRIATGKGDYTASRAIVAIAPTLANGIVFAPPLPQSRDALHQRMPMGSVIKCWIAYVRPFWRDAGLNGFVFSDKSPFSPGFDVSPPGGPGLIAGFFDARDAESWSGRTPEERKAAVVELLARTLGEQARNPIDYAECDWTQETWSRGCYAAYAPPGVLTRAGHALRAPCGRVHWAGTETATFASGYVEGALEAGERAAAEVAALA